jgi:hypothetical protein
MKNCMKCCCDYEDSEHDVCLCVQDTVTSRFGIQNYYKKAVYSGIVEKPKCYDCSDR